MNLDKTSIKIIKYLKKTNAPRNVLSIENAIREHNLLNTLLYLKDHHYIESTDTKITAKMGVTQIVSAHTFILGSEGRAYFENRKRDFILRYYPHVISTIAIIISIISLIKQL